MPFMYSSSGSLHVNASGPGKGAGLDLIAVTSFSAVASVSVDNCFTATYARYRVVMDYTTSASAIVSMRWRASGADNSSATYNTQNADSSNVTVFTRAVSATSAVLTIANGAGTQFWHSFDVYDPNLSAQTVHSGMSFLSLSSNIHGSVFTGTNAFDGFSIFPASGTISGGLRVYGYRNA